MAKALVNPEAQLASRPRDVQLSLDQLGALSVFTSLKKSPAFAKFPGSYKLRHYRPGEVICRQGEAGGTAFYLLSQADVEALAQQLSAGDGERPLGRDAPSRREFQTLLRQVRTAFAASRGGEPDGLRRLATARLLLSAPARPSAARRRWFGTAQRRATESSFVDLEPASVANDGPTDIDYQTRQASLYEGEVFGEMSCMTRQPRSATIVVDQECFALEFLRNILDQMHRDPKYKQASDQKYRERVLAGHLRKLSFFRFLTDQEYRDVQQRVELLEFAPGTVIWDEGDAADSLLVVRGGIVQVVQSFPWRMTNSAVTDWAKLLESLRQAADAAAAGKYVWDALSPELRSAISGETTAASARVGQQVLDAFNELAKSDTLLAAKETKSTLTEEQFVRQTADYPAKVKSWTGLQVRRANRVLFHLLFPDAVAPPEPIGLMRVLRYLGRGATLGEMGLVLNQPRSATCVAYAHPEGDRTSTAVEVVRVPADVVNDLASRSPRVREEIQKLVARRQRRDETIAQEPVSALSQSRRAERLGLLQGQKLMLIDLDRCTRCGDCVEACIATHDDGHSRLYLDGPRFGKYLIPSSCRQCRDPVCMIGCPVGSIQQGDNGEIRIRDWCIGCGVCARQCPYDSIQMHDAAIVPSSAPGWLWIDDATAAVNARWAQPSFRDASWRVTETPIRWGIDMHQAMVSGRGRESFSTARSVPLSTSAVEKDSRPPLNLYFRHWFQLPAGQAAADSKFQLTVASKGTSPEVYLNGRQLELTQDAPQKKRGEFAAKISGRELRRGDNLLAACVGTPGEFDVPVLDVRIDELAPESEEIEEKLVTEQAVVCDQCSSLPGNRHACVYACPHEAALRVDAWVDFPQA